MAWSLRRFSLTKDVPLTISRGTTAAVVRLELSLARDGCVGRGETGGFETGHRAFALDEVERDLLAVLPRLEGLDPTTPQQFDPLLAGLSPPARCAVDLALWDWWAQRLGQPLWGLWGLDGERSVATSVTLGLAAVPAVLERLARWWTQLPATRVKLKLGSPDGLDHDLALLSAVPWRSNGAPRSRGMRSNCRWMPTAVGASSRPGGCWSPCSPGPSSCWSSPSRLTLMPSAIVRALPICIPIAPCRWWRMKAAGT